MDLSGQQVDRTGLVNKFINEINEVDDEKLKTIADKLSFLCLEFDPYAVQNMEAREKEILEEFDLLPYLNNPFEYTRVVLQMLDTIENKINQKIH